MTTTPVNFRYHRASMVLLRSLLDSDDSLHAHGRKVLAAAILALLSAACADAEVPVYGYVVKNVYPHDEQAFTQGLLYRDGYLYESTGQYGESSVRRVELETGVVKQIRNLEQRYFGEGLVDWEDSLIVLTWRSGVGFVLGRDDFFDRRSFTYTGQGWGLTTDGKRLIMSDGTDALRFLDPESFEETGSVAVTLDGRPVGRLNELEWVDGELYANVWQSNGIVRIDPKSGVVTGIIDLTGLLPDDARRAGHTDVLNGIAYDADARRLFVTGKYWPQLFEIELVEKDAVE